MTQNPRPVLKWIGGKTSISKEILERVPKKINTYYEPFAGGLAVFFELFKQGKINKAIISDTNCELITTYQAIQKNPQGVITFLQEHQREYDYRVSKKGLEEAQKYYYHIRALPQSMLYPEGIAARMIFLNKTGFNGLYRVNKSGEFNVPFGKRKRVTICDEDNIRKVSEAFSICDFYCCDFQTIVKKFKPTVGDVIYCDPPYVPLTETSFVGYTSDGFTFEDQKRLAKMAKKIKEKDIFILLSNSGNPIVKSLYNIFTVEEVFVKRSVNSNGNGRGQVKEFLIH